MRNLLILLLHFSFAFSFPEEAKLTALFSQSRWLLSEKTLERGGFRFSSPRKFTHLIVATHPKFPGLIFKLYLDSQRPHKNTSELTFWKQRVEGAEKIRELIAKNGWEGWFKVPKKWIYQLPRRPSPPKEYWRRDYILVEEDMQLTQDPVNKRLWGKIEKEQLLAFHSLLETLGLKDCAKPDNAPFSLDGRIAFIDTQTHGAWPVDYDKLTPYLSPQMKKVWRGQK